MAPKISKDQLLVRMDMYLSERYLNLHNTLVGVALGIAGLAAANLLSASGDYEHYQTAFWMLWVASLLAVVVAYAGTVIGSVLLPAQPPEMLDLLIPLALGIFEFLLFGLLAHKVTGLTDPSRVTFAWFIAFTAFALTAAGAIGRAYWIIKPDTFSSDAAPAVDEYRSGLRRDISSAMLLATVSLTSALIDVWARPSVIRSEVFAGLLVAGFIGALITHELTAKKLRAAIT
ncbi:hypothetical protein E1293_18830 [Actinomadura darangshiensis]|uniref:Uncharacterized protein n=1 Tax=Actinomadura darangshiensis TaxID=705336 RepID=A0A4V2YVF6_9ACTN|nr:hypothetical protein [Actinomadura darangshiensis]TDD81327.1 hypothetical protein E1293_18830 [Actinomadura darangshiensis]